MSLLELPDLRQVDTQAVLRHLEEVTTRLREENPTLDLQPGVLFSLLAHYHAILAARQDKLLDSYLAARSLLVLEQQPELARPELVDDVLSNFRVERRQGRRARGSLEIIMASPDPVVVPAGSVFSFAGLRFFTEEVYTATLAEQNSGAAEDLLLVPTAAGRWSFLLPVVAEQEGPQYTLQRGTTLVPERPPRHFVTARVAADFEEGRSPETNSEVLHRLRQGVAARTVSNRVTMQAMLAERSEFASVPPNSIVGYGDAEMRRDRHGIFPLAGGGRVDWYIRTRSEAEYRTFLATAALASKRTDGFGVWQIVLDRVQAAGCYEIVSVLPADSDAYEGTLPITEVLPGTDLTGPGFVPDIVNLEEAAYSSFQTLAVRFTDTTYNVDALGLGAQRPYRVTTVGLPLIKTLQDWLSSREVRFCMADCLVKAPVPCFVTVHAVIHRQPSTPAADLENVAAAVVQEVNATPFVGRLYASRLYDVMQSRLPSDMRVAAIDLHGRLRCPDGSVRFLRSNELLQIPDEPERMVSHRTVQFFTRRQDVRLTQTTTIPEDW